MIPAAFSLITSFFLFKVIYLHCVLSQRFTKIPDGICSLTFAVNEF